MANYRQIHVSIWKDEWFMELNPQEKVLFIYLFSNESTSLTGLYKLPMRVIAFETGLKKDFILSTLEKFSQAGKVHYQDGIVWVVNLSRYHQTKSPKVDIRKAKDIDGIPDCELKRLYLDWNIQYRYTIDTRLQLKEKEEEEEKEDVNDNDTDFSSGVLANLSSVFVSETKIPELTGGAPRWIGALKDMAKSGVTPDDLRAGIRALRKKDYKIAGPWSVQNAAVMEMSARKTSKNNGDGTYTGELVS